MRTRLRSAHRPGTAIRIFILAVVAQAAAISLVMLLGLEFPASDPWYAWQAEGLTEEQSWTVEWSDAPYAVQRGDYRNWRPPLYSLFVASTGGTLKVPWTFIISQILLFACIPVLLFHILRLLIEADSDRFSIASAAAVLWIFNPQFLVSSLQVLDTMLTTLLLLGAFWGCLKLQKRSDYKRVSAVGLMIGVLYLIRPIACFAMMVFCSVGLFRNRAVRMEYKPLLLVLTGISPIILWMVVQAASGGGFHLSYSNTGYNLWLGNNRETLPFMVKHRGDAATIEDRIFADYPGELGEIADADEYHRDTLFRDAALTFIWNHPGETVANMFWKFVGFWSPFRSREGHFSASWKKEALVLCYQIPLLLFAFITVIRWLRSSEIMRGKGIGSLCLLIFLWVLPHLIFFASPRLRAPVDPLILYIAVLSIPVEIRSRIASIVKG